MKKRWERDLVDHLLLLKQVQAERPLTVDEALDELKRELPGLPREGYEAVAATEG